LRRPRLLGGRPGTTAGCRRSCLAGRLAPGSPPDTPRSCHFSASRPTVARLARITSSGTSSKAVVRLLSSITPRDAFAIACCASGQARVSAISLSHPIGAPAQAPHFVRTEYWRDGCKRGCHDAAQPERERPVHSCRAVAVTRRQRRGVLPRPARASGTGLSHPGISNGRDLRHRNVPHSTTSGPSP
jgi:hypothetical protein